jgi:hypothetical protein
MARTRNVVRLGVPALIVAGLAAVALWRVNAPMSNTSTVGTTGVRTPATPLTEIADLLVENAAGRQATLERVRIGEVTSPRTFWVGSDAERAFVVLDPDVRRHPDARIAAGARVSLIGLVRPAPPVEQAMREWQVDTATAESLHDRGTYLHVVEVRPAL